MAGAVALAVDAKELNINVRSHADLKTMTSSEYVQLLALKIRVMCSHARPKSEPSTRQGAAKRVNPFVHFRADSESEPDDDEGHCEPVAHFYDGHENKAFELHTDGARVEADRYEPGPHGFVLAFWT